MPDPDNLNEILGALDAANDQLSASQNALLLEHLGDVAARCVAAELHRLRELKGLPVDPDIVVKVERRDPRSAA